MENIRYLERIWDFLSFDWNIDSGLLKNYLDSVLHAVFFGWRGQPNVGGPFSRVGKNSTIERSREDWGTFPKICNTIINDIFEMKWNF